MTWRVWLRFFFVVWQIKAKRVNSLYLSDADAGNNSQLSYSLVSGDKSAFSIDSKTGIILSSLLFDRESKDYYSLTVRATDHGISPLSESTTVVVTILDVNDNKPDINNLPQKISVSEGKPPGSVVFVLKANDKDQGKKKTDDKSGWKRINSPPLLIYFSPINMSQWPRIFRFYLSDWSQLSPFINNWFILRILIGQKAMVPLNLRLHHSTSRVVWWTYSKN